ncbi:hypothetical protein [Gimesia aquarii]|uniref:Uncharacterized protein n=1 Tax=Gimesia aquarii TaxID=2527964 RepID=A0A517VYQ9_9PLAN|nr:hypothetical protein [Gimesia aquarii]QDT98136.1 hypothetical protein V144x_36200 [Gimesia aquarii]
MINLTSQGKTKLTREQQIQLVHLVKHLLSLGKHPLEIKRAVTLEFSLSTRSIDRYITRARREMVERLEVPIEQLRAESFFFYVSVINDAKSTQRERLRARERIDKLLGLDKPIQSRGNVWQLNLTPDDIQNMSDEELEAAYQSLLKEANEQERTTPYRIAPTTTS